jgi:rhodanese-related sulfurtransferase
MKTITPFELQMLIDKHYVEVIDVRPKHDFETVHALVARSIPLKNFEPHSVLAHRRDKPAAPIYIFGERRAQASFVACGLAAAGLAEPVVIDGGIEAWEAERLPVIRIRSWQNLRFAFVSALAAWCHRFRTLWRLTIPVFR